MPRQQSAAGSRARCAPTVPATALCPSYYSSIFTIFQTTVTTVNNKNNSIIDKKFVHVVVCCSCCLIINSLVVEEPAHEVEAHGDIALMDVFVALGLEFAEQFFGTRTVAV